MERLRQSCHTLGANHQYGIEQHFSSRLALDGCTLECIVLESFSVVVSAVVKSLVSTGHVQTIRDGFERLTHPQSLCVDLRPICRRRSSILLEVQVLIHGDSDHPDYDTGTGCECDTG